MKNVKKCKAQETESFTNYTFNNNVEFSQHNERFAIQHSVYYTYMTNQYKLQNTYQLTISFFLHSLEVQFCKQ